MNNNDILRRLRFALDYNDQTMGEIFKQAGVAVDQSALAAMLKKEGIPGFRECPNAELAKFLDGLILHRRGPRENAPAPAPVPAELTNNDILKKLRIALECKEEDMLEILKKGGTFLSPHELRALFRKKGHKHYTECGDQYLRNFLKGLTLKNRGVG